MTERCSGNPFSEGHMLERCSGTFSFLILVQCNTTPLQPNCGSGCMKLSNLTFDFNYKSVCIHAASAWFLWLSQKDLTIVHLVGGL